MAGQVLIDISRLLARFAKGSLPTGVDRVCLEYVRHFGPAADAVIHVRGWRRVASSWASRELFSLLNSPGPGFASRLVRILARACIAPSESSDVTGRVYLNVGHMGLHHAGLAEWLNARRLRGVFMVHDLIPLRYPEYCRTGESERHQARIETMVKTASGIVTNSHATREDLVAYAQERGWTLPPTVAAPLAAASLRPAPGSKSPLAQPYFVVLGTIEPRKNHHLLLHLWRELALELGSLAPHLVVIGKRGWECENVVDLLERCAPLRGLVHELPHCSDSDLAIYLAHAQALLFPSFAEGYGLPLAEAMGLGIPAITSDLPVFREVAGDIPEYLHPMDGAAWLRVIRDFAHPASKLRPAQIQRMSGYRANGWSDHFQQVEALLSRICIGG